MATAGEVADGLSGVCDKASRSVEALAGARDLVVEARSVLASALDGGISGAGDEVLAGFDEVIAGITRLSELLAGAVGQVQALVQALVGDGVPPSPTGRAGPPAERRDTGEPRTAGGPETQSDRVERLRRELPPPVVSGTGRKTHGRWIAPDGSTRVITSGMDEWSRDVNDALVEESCPKVPVVTAGDVELKLAARMREQGPGDPGMRHITVVINNVPCGGPLGCDTLVPVVLPDGYTLTVHGPNYYKKFTGGPAPWRR